MRRSLKSVLTAKIWMAQLAGYYFGTQLALSVEKLQKDMLHHQDRELAKAKKFEKQGMISKIERMSVPGPARQQKPRIPQSQRQR